jgi:hypothetical protein
VSENELAKQNLTPPRESQYAAMEEEGGKGLLILDSNPRVEELQKTLEKSREIARNEIQ